MHCIFWSKRLDWEDNWMHFSSDEIWNSPSHENAQLKFKWKISVQCLPLVNGWRLNLHDERWGRKVIIILGLPFFSITCCTSQTRWGLKFRSLKLHKLLKMQFSPISTRLAVEISSMKVKSMTIMTRMCQVSQHKNSGIHSSSGSSTPPCYDNIYECSRRT